MSHRPGVTLLLALVLGACSSGDPDPFPSLPSDPCSLVSEGDVERTMGSAVVRVIRAASERTPTPDGPVVCVYKIPGPYGSVVVSVEPDGTDRFTTALNENPRDADTIDRLGDEAFAGGMASVWVRVDEGFFVVGVQRNPGPDAVQDLRTLAGAALDNIPARQ